MSFEAINEGALSEYRLVDGTTRSLEHCDFMIVTPYNEQVRCPRELLPRWRPDRHGRQVPRARGASHLLLYGDLERCRCSTKFGVPVLAEPTNVAISPAVRTIDG
jgi:hypothetical protein